MYEIRSALTAFIHQFYELLFNALATRENIILGSHRLITYPVSNMRIPAIGEFSANLFVGPTNRSRVNGIQLSLGLENYLMETLDIRAISCFQLKNCYKTLI